MTMLTEVAKCYCGVPLVLVSTPQENDTSGIYFDVSLAHAGSWFNTFKFRLGADIPSSVFAAYMIERITEWFNQMSPEDRPSCFGAWVQAAEWDEWRVK